jgi:hypothetical protein
MYIFHNYNLKRKFFQGSSMTDEGLVSVFAIGDVSNNLAAVDWIIPLSGIGNWDRMKQTRQNVPYDCRRHHITISRLSPCHGWIIKFIFNNILRDPAVRLEQLTRRSAILVYSEETGNYIALPV